MKKSVMWIVVATLVAAMPLTVDAFGGRKRKAKRCASSPSACQPQGESVGFDQGQAYGQESFNANAYQQPQYATYLSRGGYSEKQYGGSEKQGPEMQGPEKQHNGQQQWSRK